MKTSVFTAILFLILLGGIGDVASSANGDKEADSGKEVHGSRFGIAPASPSFRYDQPGILNLTVKNFRKEEISVPFGNNWSIYRFDVRLPNGKPAPLTLEGTRLANDRVVDEGTVQVKPGASYTEGIVLNRYYDMTLLGEYTISMQRKVPSPTRPDGTWTWELATSNTLKVTVREYTAEELKERQQQESNEK